MTKERVIKYAKEYLTHTHDTLRKAFTASEERAAITPILEGIEKNVEKLELLEEALRLKHKSKEKKEQFEIEE